MKKLLVLACVVVGVSGCVADRPEDEEEIAESSEAVTAINVAPALELEFNRIRNTPTGQTVLARARARRLHTIKVGPLPGAICGLYQSNGVITIESPNNVYTFQRLAHELLHAGGYHPHYFPDKGLVGKMCNEANVACPSWD